MQHETNVIDAGTTTHGMEKLLMHCGFGGSA